MAVICGYAGKLMPVVIDMVNGSGPAPEAVTLGGTTFFFAKKGSPALERHEHRHVVQAAECAPGWAAWLPLRARAWLGARKFWSKYVDFHLKYGYALNPLEVEARGDE